jgi:hypothetical protein
MFRKIRSLALVFVLGTLFVPSAYAQPRPSWISGFETVGFLGHTWAWLAALALPAVPRHAPGAVATWSKLGPAMDPDGLTGTLLPGSTTKPSVRAGNGEPKGH